MAINHYNTHIRMKNASLTLTQRNLQKGMIVQSRYKKKNNTSKNYMFLVLNSSFKGHVHLLSLNEMSPRQLNNLARITGLKRIPKYLYSGIDFEKLLILESSNRFYIHKLRGKLKTKYNSSYRTFIKKNLGILTLVDYNWDDDIPVPPKGMTTNQFKKLPPFGKTQIPKDYDGRLFEDVEE